MAYSTNSKTLHYPSWKFMFLIITLSLVLSYGTATRSMAMTTTTTMMNSKEKEEAFRTFSVPNKGDTDEKKEIDVKDKNLFNTMLPKGIPIPPSGPSKRHN
ncbi:Protein IDA [Capsicum baccatum]|uniref:Protein IDA n=1 Tax=Capsicum baccatum TaxID=33114 RepID=A0A2G2VKJ9_CAPBA|nr:Protein IDA [Capsicum baccatum]